MVMLRKWAVATILLLTMFTLTSFAQGPLQKHVIYTINADHALRMGDYILPAGRYELFQINSNNPNLFALYQNDRMRSPIALIHTVRVDYQSRGYPDKTQIMYTIDEETRSVARGRARGRENLPVLRGWTIPGFDGWEIISVVEKKKGVLARVRSGRELARR